MKKTSCLVVLVTAVFAASCNRNVELIPVPNVLAELKVQQDKDPAGGIVFNATVTLTNPGEQSVWLDSRVTCKHCATQDATNNLFVITQTTGAGVPYVASQAPVMAPSAEEMVELPPGASLSFTTDLHHGYLLSSQDKQTYKVQYHTVSLQPLDSGRPDVALKSQEVIATFDPAGGMN